MEIYHGSVNRVEHPIFGAGSSANDYGRGFYCTESEELAKEWACLRGTDGFANKYELFLDGLTVINLNGPGYHILNWLAILAKHRSYWERSSLSFEAKEYLQQHFLPDVSGADVICGYRADDSYFSFAKAFVSNGLTLEQLQKAIMLGELGEQIVLVSEKAFSQIEPRGASFAPKDPYATIAMERDRAAHRAYRELIRTSSNVSGLLMVDIMRRGMKNEDFLR